VSPTAGLDAAKKRNISCCCQESNQFLDFPAHSLVIQAEHNVQKLDQFPSSKCIGGGGTEFGLLERTELCH
jgi:hypothetical protein